MLEYIYNANGYTYIFEFGRYFKSTFDENSILFDVRGNGLKLFDEDLNYFVRDSRYRIVIRLWLNDCELVE